MRYDGPDTGNMSPQAKRDYATGGSLSVDPSDRLDRMQTSQLGNSVEETLSGLSGLIIKSDDLVNRLKNLTGELSITADKVLGCEPVCDSKSPEFGEGNGLVDNLNNRLEHMSFVLSHLEEQARRLSRI